MNNEEAKEIEWSGKTIRLNLTFLQFEWKSIDTSVGRGKKLLLFRKNDEV